MEEFGFPRLSPTDTFKLHDHKQASPGGRYGFSDNKSVGALVFQNLLPHPYCASDCSVGSGSSFDWISMTETEMMRRTDQPENVVDALVKRDHSKARIVEILVVLLDVLGIALRNLS